LLEETMTTNKQTSAPTNGVKSSNGSAHEDMQSAPVGEIMENPLSDREMEVARLLVTGATNSEIARVLVISPHTVKVHLRNVFDKLQVSSRTEASMLLVQRGWVVVPGVGVTGAESSAVHEETPVVEAPVIAEPEPLANVEAKPRPWQISIVLVALAIALVTLLIPPWITTPKSRVALLSDGGQTILGKPVLNSLPYRWEVQPPLSQPRSRMGAIVDGDKIYVIGGEGEEGTPLGLVEVFDLLTKQWQQASPLPAPRANLAVAVDGSDLIVAGGSHLENNTAATDMTIYDDMVRYHRDQDSWTPAGKLPVPLAGMAMAVHGDNLYVLGGWDGQAMQDSVWGLPLGKVDSARPEDWTVVTHLPEAKAWFGAVMVDDQLYVVGGYDGRRELADFAVYNVANNEWRHLASLITPRGGVTLVYDGLTVLALGGGWDNTVQNHERYDAMTNQWTTITSPISGEWRHFGAVANDGSVYIFGGWSGAYLDSTLQFQSTFRALLPSIPNRGNGQ
jgi:DNA-binding CsgD family transcriptional regulator/N-acetylneuraminic acid mutarotase